MSVRGMGRYVLIAGAVIGLLAASGCSLFGGSGDALPADITAVAGETAISRPAKSGVVPLNNANWDLALEDADKYSGSPVNITGIVFYAVGDYDGASHYQIFTNPDEQAGNTHVAVPAGPKLAEGDRIEVVGTLDHMLVTTSRGGTELRIPYVIANVVTVLAGPNFVGTPTPTALLTPTAVLTPAETTTPTATPVPNAVATSTSTAATEAMTGSVTAAASVTGTPSVTNGAQTVAAVTPTATPGPFTVVVPPAGLTTGGSLRTIADPGAPNGQYFTADMGSREWNGIDSLPDGVGEATFNISVPRNGRYAVWVNMQYQSVDANSLWLLVDQQKAILVGNEAGNYGPWRWVGWRDGNLGARLVVDLTSGQHAITIAGREAGTRFSDVLLSDDIGFQPVEIGAVSQAAHATMTPAQGSTASNAPIPTVPPPTSTPAIVPATASPTPASSTATPTTARLTLIPTPTPSPLPPTKTSVPSPTASPTAQASAPTPTPTRMPSPTPSSANQIGGGSYTVLSGDTLWSIAQRAYGDASQYSRIYAANRDKLSSPDRIFPGTQLQIPW